MQKASEKEKIIEGLHVTKVFKDFWERPKVTALKDVDITVSSGTIFGLLGPNGAGKSTLIKIILGHLYPSGGILTVFGKSPRDIKIKERIGYLPEHTAFYTNLTSEETLMFFSSLLGLPGMESKRRINQLLEMVGLEHTRKRLVGEFSHGMRRRLALAQSLLNDPDLLLLDEPTAGMDPIGCREIKDLILTLGKRGKTILMTSHLLPDVQDVCNIIMILYGGQVQAVGPVDELLARKDEIQIRSSMVSQETLKKVETLLLSENKKNRLDISYPIRTLEDYFLSVVAEAHRSRQKTSGAQIGHGVADYLTKGLTPHKPESFPHENTDAAAQIKDNE